MEKLAQVSPSTVHFSKMESALRLSVQAHPALFGQLWQVLALLLGSGRAQDCTQQSTYFPLPTSVHSPGSHWFLRMIWEIHSRITHSSELQDSLIPGKGPCAQGALCPEQWLSILPNPNGHSFRSFCTNTTKMLEPPYLASIMSPNVGRFTPVVVCCRLNFSSWLNTISV